MLHIDCRILLLKYPHFIVSHFFTYNIIWVFFGCYKSYKKSRGHFHHIPLSMSIYRHIYSTENKLLKNYTLNADLKRKEFPYLITNGVPAVSLHRNPMGVLEAAQRVNFFIAKISFSMHTFSLYMS